MNKQINKQAKYNYIVRGDKNFASERLSDSMKSD